jgi:hypothetical protein
MFVDGALAHGVQAQGGIEGFTLARHAVSWSPMPRSAGSFKKTEAV